MSSHVGICERPLKRERVDEEIEMVNYEMPMQIEVPDAADAEIDPLMPVETNAEEPADIVQPSGLVDFVRPIKSDLEVMDESSGETDSSLPKIGSVIPNFVCPSGQVPAPFVVENAESLVRCDDVELTHVVKEEIYVSDDETSDVEEITIEPKSEQISEEVSDSANCDFRLVIGADGPQIQQLSRSQQTLKEQYSSALKAQLLKPLKSKELDKLRVPDPAVAGVQKMMQYFKEPLSGSNQNVTYRENAFQGQEQDVSNSANLSPSVSVDRQTNCNETPVLGISGHPETLDSQQLNGRNQPTFQPCSSAAAVPVVPSSHQEPEKNSSSILEPVSVSRLFENPFSSGTWTNEQKNAIVKLSRPTPEIDTLRGTSAKRFYNEIPWLCGSSSLKKFLCWPCLLFFYSPTNTQLLWSVSVTLALDGGFKQSCEYHKTSSIHRAAEKALKNWPQNVKSPSPPNPNKKQRTNNLSIVERVRKNRKLLSLLVQSICYLKKENHNAQIKDYAECFGYVVPSNWELQETLRDFQGNLSKESSWDFVFNYAHLVEDAVEKFLKYKKSDELKAARFVTLFMEDLSSIVDDSKVAVIAHFVDQAGEIQQRIIDMNEIGFDRSASAVFMLFQRVVFQLGLRLKVAGFTYSATLVHPSDITAFNERVERLCPVAKFFHYQGHNLTGMLFGALSHLNRSCRNFFQTIVELQEFFKTYLIPTFHHFEQLNHSQSELPYQSYDFDYGFITTLKRSYSSVLETFGSILARPNEWEYGVSSYAPIFMSFLQNNTTRFLVVLISQLNLALMDVSSALQGKIDIAEWKLLIRRATGNFISIKNFGFNDVYAMSLSPILVKDNVVQCPDVPSDLLTIFNEIIDTAISFLHQRFDTVDFGYIDLETVATRYYTRLHLNAEDINKFRLQIQLLAKEPTIKDKTLAEALKHFHNYNLGVTIPEYATFLDFAMTIPSSRSSLNCPAVERILFQRNRSRKQNFPKHLIWIEKELLADVLKNKKLCEAVIDILVNDNERMSEFSYTKF